MDENVARVIPVSGDEIGGIGTERDVATIVGDIGGVRPQIGLDASGADRDQERLPRLQVADEDIALIVRIAGDQVAGRAVEHNIATVAREFGTIGVVVAHSATRADRDTTRLAGLPVMDKDVPRLIRVPRHEVAGVGLERHVAAVIGDGRVVGIVVALHATGTNRDTGGLSRLPVTDKDIGHPICIAANEVNGDRLKGYIAAVR